MKLEKEITILIHTCDKFSDLWDAQISLLKKHWHNYSLYHIILLTDTNKNNYFYDCVDIICSGENGQITDRIKKVLPYIQTNYVFVTLDDYMLINFANLERIKYDINFLKEQDGDYIRLFLRTKPTRKEKIKSEKNMYRITNNKVYSINLYPSIWKKTFLEQSIDGCSKNAWEYEVFLSRVAVNHNSKCFVSLNKEYEILDSVRKGKFLNRPFLYLKKNNLYNGKRELNSRLFELKLNIRTFIGRHIPNFIYVFLKKIMRKRGYKFYSDYDEK